MRLFGECFGRFTSDFSRDGIAYRATWWQFGRRIFRERYVVSAWPVPTLPSVS